MEANKKRIEEDPDIINMREWLARDPITESVAHFVPGPNIKKLALSFDPDKLKTALQEVLAKKSYQGDMQQQGFSAIPLTGRPGFPLQEANELSGRYWLRKDDRYIEEPMEELVDEIAFSEFDPDLKESYFATVHKELSLRFKIGRMRILSKGLYNCNSWHRDPEPRLHIPIITNPGSLFIVNHHATHLPADGSVYFTDTRGYHTALNGGLFHRVHIVAAIIK